MMSRIVVLLFLLLTAFTASAQLEVTGQGSATLTWVVPTEREDGQPLPITELSGYVIFYADQSRFLPDGTTLRTGCTERPSSTDDTSCYGVALNIVPGDLTTQTIFISVDQDTTLWFSMSAYDTDGRLSTYSNEASKTITLILDSPPDAPVIQSLEMIISCTTNDPNVECEFVISP